MINNLIKTKYVFAKNNQVYIKNTSKISSEENTNLKQEEWTPINFQWIPIVELNKNLKLK
jgi:hypothetical protein